MHFEYEYGKRLFALLSDKDVQIHYIFHHILFSYLLVVHFLRCNDGLIFLANRKPQKAQSSDSTWGMSSYGTASPQQTLPRPQQLSVPTFLAVLRSSGE
jgi:hypothetical protein